MTSTNADMANPSLNVSRQSKPNISSESYTKVFVVIIPVHAPWLPEFLEPNTSGLGKFYTGLGIKHITSSIEHPQTNGQAEAANKVILVELRKRLDTAKGRWPEELIEVLWAYRCTPNHQQTNPHSA